MLRKLVGDLAGISHVLGLTYTLRWLAALVVTFPAILATHNLQPADRKMGIGPFDIRMRRYGVAFRVIGPSAFSGIREMYVRDAYLQRGALQIRDGDIVLDFGANMGNFTNLALAHGQRVTVIAVEPGREAISQCWQSISLNKGFSERVTLVRAFLGNPGSKQEQMSNEPQYEDAPCMTESDFIRVTGVARVDFLKCDIEGGEFGLLGPDSELLRMARQLAVEVHAFAGDVEAFIGMIEDSGFEIRHVKRDPDGTATVLAMRH